MYIKIGKLVYLKGSCKGFKSGNVICTHAGTSGNRIAKAMITSGGYVQMLADTNVNANFDENQWYSFCTSFVAEQ